MQEWRSGTNTRKQKSRTKEDQKRVDEIVTTNTLIILLINCVTRSKGERLYGADAKKDVAY